MGPERPLPADDRGCYGMRVSAGWSGVGRVSPEVRGMMAARLRARGDKAGCRGTGGDERRGPPTEAGFSGVRRSGGGISGDSGRGAGVGHGGVGHAVEHPERNFLPADRGAPSAAHRASPARLPSDIMDPDQAVTPGTPRIQHSTGVGPMGGLAFGCTMISVHTARSARVPRSSGPGPRGRNPSLGLTEPGFSRIPWPNIGGKSVCPVHQH